MENARAQTYDGAANMQGKENGCGALIKNEYPLVLRFHCRAHAANLVLQKACEASPLVNNALTVLQDLAKFYKKSITVSCTDYDFKI